jgi:hypothetical protein
LDVTLSRDSAPNRANINLMAPRSSATPPRPTAAKPTRDWKMYRTRSPSPNGQLLGRAPATIIASARAEDVKLADLVRSDVRTLHKALDDSLPKGTKEILLAEMATARQTVSALAQEGRAFAALVEAARAWSAIPLVLPPHPASLPVAPDATTLAAVRHAIKVIEPEAARRAEMSAFEQFSYGALVAAPSGPPAVAQWLAARGIAHAVGPAELVLVEAILEAEGKLEAAPGGATWWEDKRRALRRWAEAYSEVAPREPVPGKRKPRKR